MRPAILGAILITTAFAVFLAWFSSGTDLPTFISENPDKVAKTAGAFGLLLLLNKMILGSRGAKPRLEQVLLPYPEARPSMGGTPPGMVRDPRREMLVLETHDGPDSVVDYYRRTAQNAGWAMEEIGGATSDPRFLLKQSARQLLVRVTVVPTGGVTQIAYEMLE